MSLASKTKNVLFPKIASRSLCIYDLPIDIIIQILSLLDPDTLDTIGLIDSFFNDLVINNRIWFNMFKYNFSIRNSLLNQKIYNISQKIPANNKKKLLLQNELNQNLIDSNYKILFRFPSLSNSVYWKFEYLIRNQFINEFLKKKNFKKNNKLSKSSKKFLLNKSPNLLVSSYKINNNDNIDNIYCDFNNDILHLFSSRSYNLNTLTLRQGKSNYLQNCLLRNINNNTINYNHNNIINNNIDDIDNDLNENENENENENDNENENENLITCFKMSKNYLLICNYYGRIYLKNYYKLNERNLNFSYKNFDYFKLCEHLNKIPITSVKINQLSKFNYKKSKNLINNNNTYNESKFIDFISGDYLGNVYLWGINELKNNRILLKFNINDKLDFNTMINEYNDNHKDKEKQKKKQKFYPILKIESNFKRYVIIESINLCLFLIELIPTNYTAENGNFYDYSIRMINKEELDLKINPNVIKLNYDDINNDNNDNNDNIDNNYTYSSVLKLVRGKEKKLQTFLKVDYNARKIIYCFEDNILIKHFSKEKKSYFMDCKLKDDDLSVKEYIIQVKIINNYDNGYENGKIAGENSGLIGILFNTGKILISGINNDHYNYHYNDQNNNNNNNDNNDESEDPLIIKVYPNYLNDNSRFNNDIKLIPITRIDFNKLILVASSYNGNFLIINILNGEILKEINNKIDRKLLNDNFNNEVNNGINNGIEDSLIATTCIKLNEFKFSINEEDKENEKKYLINGIIVLNNIVEYFQISFNNSFNNLSNFSKNNLNKKNGVGKKLNQRRINNFNEFEQLEEMKEYHHDEMKKRELVNKIYKMNGIGHDEELDENEQLRLAIAMSESLQLQEKLNGGNGESGGYGTDQKHDQSSKKFERDYEAEMIERAIALSILESNNPRNTHEIYDPTHFEGTSGDHGGYDDIDAEDDEERQLQRVLALSRREQ
ncbi:F-box protein ASCRUDRAFT_68970 [Ascoidea rubescens DSM 1968]|uniref:F-box domain-containing protein n=1 Tax=Ascoidea rubescens DSM 1968 TaxID=1344418 RepID=A0A1D2VNQ2_9ASCO|nr:hypothetical protein ASCRUDRAFT_68970 [Ascoidea rubescens DSM 1968]ODV63214.1 hypothetical protein ASCRUDRAFT_68970 [Ascoidea rubescens DSM 1968]